MRITHPKATIDCLDTCNTYSGEGAEAIVNAFDEEFREQVAAEYPTVLIHWVYATHELADISVDLGEDDTTVDEEGELLIEDEVINHLQYIGDQLGQDEGAKWMRLSGKYFNTKVNN